MLQHRLSRKGCAVWMVTSGLGRRMWDWLLTLRGMAASPLGMIRYGQDLTKSLAVAGLAKSSCA